MGGGGGGGKVQLWGWGVPGLAIGQIRTGGGGGGGCSCDWPYTNGRGVPLRLAKYERAGGGGGGGMQGSAHSLLDGSSTLVLSPDPDSQQLRVDYITATWVWEIRTTHLFRAYQNIETHVYIRNDADVTLIRRASCRLPDFKCKVCLN